MAYPALLVSISWLRAAGWLFALHQHESLTAAGLLGSKVIWLLEVVDKEQPARQTWAGRP